MKKTLLLLGGLLTAALARAQAPAWEAVYSLGPVDSNFSAVRVLAADNSGNLYVAGSFTGIIGVGGTLLTAAGGTDAFVARWSPATRSFGWVQQLGSPGEEQVNALAVSGSAVYVGGVFSGSSLAFGATTLTNPGGSTGSGFVARLTDGGSSAAWAWAQPAAAGSYEGVRALAVSGTSVYAAGSFEGTTATLGATTLTNSGGIPGVASSDLYVAKLTDGGSSAAFTWVARSSGPAGSSERPGGLTVAGGNVYVAGTLGSSASFSPSSPALTITAANGGNAFVARLTDAGSTGSFGWAAATGGVGGAEPRSLVARGSTLYLGGQFRGSPATFGATSLTKSGLASNATADVFVTSFTDAGTAPSFGWALRAGGPASDSLGALVPTASGVYVGGRFATSADFGSTILVASQQAPPQPYRYDVFAGRITEASGSAAWTWAVRAGGLAVDEAAAVAISGSRLYVGGMVTPVAEFGTLAVSGGTRPLGFLASISDPTLPTRTSRERPGLVVFPSPAHGAATVQVPAGPGPATVQVRDALGRVVWGGSAPAGQDYPLDLHGLTPGVYAVYVQVGEATAVQRLAVE